MSEALASRATRPARSPAEGRPTPDGRQQILDAAAALLSRRGYGGTTTRDIAAAAGIKAASIYHHFPSKNALVGAVVDEGVRVVRDAVVGALARLPPASTPRDRLETAIRQHLLASLEHSDFTSASIRSFAFLPEDVRRDCRRERRRYEEVWRALVAELGAAGLLPAGISLDRVRLLLLGAVNWAGEWYRSDRMDIDAIARDFAACVLHAPAAEPGRPAEPRARRRASR